MGVLDVALAVDLPGRRQELHRPLGAGGRQAVDAPDPGLDQVDGGQVLPRHPRRGLGLVVPGHEVGGRRGRLDAPGRHLGRRGAGQRPQVAPGGRMGGGDGLQLGRQPGEDRGVPLGVVAELAIGHLLGQAGAGEVGRRHPRLADRGLGRRDLLRQRDRIARRGRRAQRGRVERHGGGRGRRRRGRRRAAPSWSSWGAPRRRPTRRPRRPRSQPRRRRPPHGRDDDRARRLNLLRRGRRPGRRRARRPPP